MYGTNGGGFFGANSAHPFENPTPLTNLVQMLLIFMIPSGFTYALGRMTRSQRHGWAVWSAMAAMFLGGVLVVYAAESRGNPLLKGVETKAGEIQPGGNMEGKEVRFGISNSALFTTVTTDASCGAVNNAHDSLTPLGGMIPLVNIMLGEVIFGGVGAGMYGMLVFVILAVFIAGLMVGRTPEYLGKKIEAFDVKMATLAIPLRSYRPGRGGRVHTGRWRSNRGRRLGRRIGNHRRIRSCHSGIGRRPLGRDRGNSRAFR